MIKKYVKALFIAFAIFIVVPYNAHADIGPKPSVEIEFLGIGNKTVYATLMSEYEFYGPYASFQGDNAIYTEEDEEYPIWQKFVEYQDSDNFYFLQNLYKCDIDNNTIHWGYFPPEPFKLLVYYLDTDTFVESSVYNRYAFDSVYIAPLNEAKDGHFELQKNYSYFKDVMGFAVRMVCTVAVEMLIAVRFGYTEKKTFKLIAVVNAVTQLILNIGLAMAIYNGGALFFTICYIIGEAVVFLIEAILYSIKLPELSEKHTGVLRALLYAFVANALSLAVGFYAGLWLSV